MNRRIVVVFGLRIQVGEDKKGEGGSETEGLDLQLVLEPRHEATRARERESEVEAEEGDGVDDHAKDQRELLRAARVGVVRGQKRDLRVEERREWRLVRRIGGEEYIISCEMSLTISVLS